MAQRQLLTDEERRTLLGVPSDPDHFGATVHADPCRSGSRGRHRGDTNRLGAAVQLALLRYPGTTLANLDQQPEPLVTWLAAQLEIPATMFARHACRPQTMTDHGPPARHRSGAALTDRG